jgi:hypothetical protein
MSDITKVPEIKKIDEARLESDTVYRFEFMAEFGGVTADDLQAIQDSATVLGPVVGQLVDAVYEKLFGYDCTKRHFVKAAAAYTGKPESAIDDFTLQNEYIAFRKEHLTSYVVRLVSGGYDAKFIQYIDSVGKIHTDKAGNPAVVIPLVQMNALMTFVADAVISTLFALVKEPAALKRYVTAWNKLLWVQNDFITRHYQK